MRLTDKEINEVKIARALKILSQPECYAEHEIAWAESINPTPDQITIPAIQRSLSFSSSE